MEHPIDSVIAAIEANHPNQKMLYVEISSVRDRAELVTDDRAGLAEQIEALEALGAGGARGAQTGAAREAGTSLEGAQPGTSLEGAQPGKGGAKEPEKTPEPKTADRDLGR